MDTVKFFLETQYFPNTMFDRRLRDDLFEDPELSRVMKTHIQKFPQSSTAFEAIISKAPRPTQYTFSVSGRYTFLYHATTSMPTPTPGDGAKKQYSIQ